MIKLNTTDHLKEEILVLMDECNNSTNKVNGITYDNATNITNAVRNLENQLNLYSNRCTAHTVQLVIKKVSEENSYS